MCGMRHTREKIRENVKTKVVDEMLTKFNTLSFDLNTCRRTTNRGSLNRPTQHGVILNLCSGIWRYQRHLPNMTQSK